MPTTFSKNLTLFFSLSLFSLSLMFLDYFSLLAWLRQRVEKVANPVKWEMAQTIRSFHFRKKSLQEAVILQAKLDHFEREKAAFQVELKNLRQENEVLRKQLKITPAVKQNLLPAKNLSILGGVMMLDKGEKASVKKGMIVSLEGILIGKVLTVTPETSSVALPTQESSEIKVKILPSGEKGFLKGNAEGRLVLEEVLQKVKLKADQLVITSGEEGEYPADLPIGKIEKIFKEDVQIYQKAEVKPLLDYQSLPVVMIRI